MSLGKNVVVHGATLKCSQSETLSFLRAKDFQMEIDGKYVATVDDHKPADNILPFGICKHPKWLNKPCKPVTLTPWKPGETTVEFGSQVVIDVESKCKCKIGGTITIEDPGQAHPFFSVDDENYSHAALDFERVRNLHLKESREWKNSAEDEADSLQQDLATQLLNTAVETGKQVFGDDPLEIGLGLINPWKKVKLLSKLKNLPGALKDAWKARKARKRAGKLKTQADNVPSKRATGRRGNPLPAKPPRRGVRGGSRSEASVLPKQSPPQKPRPGYPNAPKRPQPTAPAKPSPAQVENMTTAEKSVFGEAQVDQILTKKGYSKQNGEITRVGDTPRGHGIDGVYTNANPPPEFVIVDAKYGQGSLGTLKDGTRQMSDDWIDPRLNKSVGEDLADEIRSSDYERVVAKVDKNGDVTWRRVDADGYVIRGNDGVFKP